MVTWSVGILAHNAQRHVIQVVVWEKKKDNCGGRKISYWPFAKCGASCCRMDFMIAELALGPGFCLSVRVFCQRTRPLSCTWCCNWRELAHISLRATELPTGARSKIQLDVYFHKKASGRVPDYQWYYYAQFLCGLHPLQEFIRTFIIILEYHESATRRR